MAPWDIGFRHIVDVDGQLLSIDAEVIDPSSLLARAGKRSDGHLWLVRAGERFPLQARQLLRLSQDEVLFFETGDRRSADLAFRMAA